MQFTLNLKAGQRMRQQTAGKLFMLLSPGVAPQIQVTLYDGTNELEAIRTGQRGFTARMLSGGFTHVDLLSSVDTAAEIIISSQDIDFDFVSGATVNANIQSLPLPVSNDRGSPGNLLYVSAVSVTDAPATAVADNPAVAVASGATAIVGANSNRRELRLANIGTSPVAIGGAGITWAKRTIVLQPGDLWVETRGAALAWSGICDAAMTASVTSQEVTA